MVAASEGMKLSARLIVRAVVVFFKEEGVMARAVITIDFASATETAEVLGVSRANTKKLIQMAEQSLAAARHRRSKAKHNGAKANGRKARTRR
jgi:hypothetical protein